MHPYPAALDHLRAIRDAVGRSDEPEVRVMACLLIDRLEQHFLSQSLSGEALLVVLDTLRAVPGTEVAIDALYEIASGRDNV